MTRAKSNLNAHRVYSAAVDRTTGVIADQTITLDGHYTSKDYRISGGYGSEIPKLESRWCFLPTEQPYRH